MDLYVTQYMSTFTPFVIILMLVATFRSGLPVQTFSTDPNCTFLIHRLCFYPAREMMESGRKSTDYINMVIYMSRDLMLLNLVCSLHLLFICTCLGPGLIGDIRYACWILIKDLRGNGEMN